MGKILLLIFLVINAIYSLFHPWFGVTTGYLFNILGPQYIWWWPFQGLRAFYFIALPTIAGFFLNLFQGTIRFDIIKNRRSVFSILYFVFVFLSYFWGPYVDEVNRWRFYDPYEILILMFKIFIFYFIGLLTISTEKRLKIFSFVLPLSALYLIYWANMKYLSGPFFLRLRGPVDITGAGTYRDENNFAMLFVVSIPFLFYLGWYLKRWYLKLLFWISIPFAWHAIFLTASRGGLLGTTFVTLLSALRCPKKIIGIMLIPIFLIAFVWQGGSILKYRAKTIKSYEEETSARARIEAWKAGLKMILAHPFTGVGLASFGQAFPYFSDKKPRLAHNTFVQITAESGIFAGIFYVLFMFSCCWGLYRIRDKCSISSIKYYLCDAVLISLCGFLFCSLFLTLNWFEIQFYLAILANTLIYLSSRKRI